MHKLSDFFSNIFASTNVKWRNWIIISFFFTMLFLLMLPFKPVLTFDTGINIYASGEKNILSKGSEVWVDLDTSNFLLSYKNSRDPGWELRDGQLLSYQHQPAKITSNIKFDRDSVLTFSKHAYSGVLNIKTGGQLTRYDLYSATGERLIIKLSDLPGVKIAIFDTLLHFFSYFLSCFVFLLIITYAAHKNINKLYISDYSVKIKPLQITLYSLPSIFVYIFSILIYYPAQMSPDSISQWEQVMHGDYNDAHPVLSTLIYSGINHIAPGPQWVVFSMSALLAVTWGWALSEALSWGVNRKLIIFASVLFPIFPPTFLLASTMWKDVPFGTGLLLISVLTSYLVRRRFVFCPAIIIGYVIAGLLVLGTRHNGIVIIIPFFIALSFFAKQKKQKRVVFSLIIFQCVAFILTKTILITALHAGGIGAHYKSIYALHVLGAMQQSGVTWNEGEKEIINNILPAQAWKDGYRCDTVVTLFWHKDIAWKYLGNNTKSINELALKSILKHPMVFLHHQLCVTSMVWRINPLANEFVAFTPLQITQMPINDSLGLYMSSKLPNIKDSINDFDENYLRLNSEWVRPAAYLFLGLFLTVMMVLKYGSSTILIFLPAVLNAASWILLSGSQDYRYMWPVILITFYLFLLVFGRTTKPNQLV